MLPARAAIAGFALRGKAKAIDRKPGIGARTSAKWPTADIETAAAERPLCAKSRHRSTSAGFGRGRRYGVPIQGEALRLGSAAARCFRIARPEQILRGNPPHLQRKIVRRRVEPFHFSPRYAGDEAFIIREVEEMFRR